jgi:hypothetical protein
MKKRYLIPTILILLFLVGCAAEKAPELVCEKPYIRHGTGCCMDQNENFICDDDELDTMFEPTYADVEEPVVVKEEAKPSAPAAYEIVYEETESEGVPVVEEEEEVVEGGKPVASSYVSETPAKVPMRGWEVKSDFMLMKVTDIGIEVKSVKPKDLISADTDVYLQYIDMTIINTGEVKNRDYVYLNPELSIRVGDSFDYGVVRETLLCDAGDYHKVENCDNALEEGESMDIRVHINQRLPRPDMEKRFWITLENRRDTKSANILELMKTVDILNIQGATYTQS